ncbi:MAG: hypothetical protein ACP5NW_04795 [Candidatus Woesearchaeota archaeon]
MSLYRNTLWLSFVAFTFLFLSVIVILEDKHVWSEEKNSIDSITGEVTSTKVEVLPVSSKNCSFTLYPGWNMISFYCLGLFNNRSIVLQTIGDHYGSIFEYQANDLSDPWKSYNPNLPSWTVQQLHYMDRISGYWIYIYNQTNFSYSGIYSDSSIPLYSGWNLVGYPDISSENISVGLAGIPFTMVKNYEKITLTNNETNDTYYSGSDVWLVYTNGSSGNTLEQFDTYKGYWINVTQNRTWGIIK